MFSVFVGISLTCITDLYSILIQKSVLVYFVYYILTNCATLEGNSAIIIIFPQLKQLAICVMMRENAASLHELLCDFPRF